MKTASADQTTLEYLQYEGTKFSKSKNVGVFGQNARETGVPPSVWRYYLLQNRPETNDSEFTWDDFVAKANAELLNNIGNFVNRMIKFVNAKFDSILPDPKEGQFNYEGSSAAYPFNEDDQAFVADIDALLKTFNEQMSHQKIRGGLLTAMQISSRGNLFIQQNRLDNALLASQPQRTAEVVLLTINLIYVVAAVFHPFMPSTSDAILAQLDATPRSIPDTFSIDLLPGHKLGTAQHLFSRIDPKQVPIWRAQFGGASAADKAPGGTGSGAGGDGGPKLSKKAQIKLAKAAKKEQDAAAAKVDAGPKSDHQLALEAHIKEQGEIVRALKTTGSVAGEESGQAALSVEEEVAKLKKSKAELAEVTAALKAAAL